jgi:hypothetical protein
MKKSPELPVIKNEVESLEKKDSDINAAELEASKEYRELAQQVVNALVKGNIQYVRDNLSANMKESNAAEALMYSLQTLS